MKKKVLIADDSSVIRIAIKTALAGVPELECEAASNGEEALRKLAETSYDWLILDMEMPILDGLGVLQKLQELRHPVRTVIFAAQTKDSYPRIIEALKRGALEFVAKPNAMSVGVVGDAIAKIREDLLPILLDEGRGFKAPSAAESGACARTQELQQKMQNRRVDAIVIASSTGGPLALEEFFSQVKGPITVPVILVQHMPALFTEALADRIAQITGVPCTEAKYGEKILPGKIYVAPGDYHLEFVKTEQATQAIIHQGPKVQFVRPAADPMFTSAAKIYGENLLAFVLTGMGADGADGSAAVKAAGGTVVIQDKDSSAVWGMPGAVFDRGQHDLIANLKECASIMKFYTSNGRAS